MRKFSFVRTYEYHPSYYDYWKLIELCGFDMCDPSQIDLQDNRVYIFTGTRTEFIKRQERLGPMKPHSRRASLVYYQIERPDSGPGEEALPLHGVVFGHMDRFLREFDLVWMPYGHLPKIDPRIIYVPMGSHPGLREVHLEMEKEYELAIIADMNGARRAPLAEGLRSRWKTAWTANGAARARALASSRAMFTVHQTASPLPEPQRLAFCAAYELPYLSDTVLDQSPLVDGQDFLSAPMEGILGTLEGWMARPDLPQIGKSLHRKLVLEDTFERCILRAVSGVQA